MAATTRDVFLLHRLVSLTYPAIADRLDLSVVEVERHVASAILHLARALDDAG